MRIEPPAENEMSALLPTETLKMNELYDKTETYHDGKWLWIPIEFDRSDIQKLLLIKRRPNRKQV